MENRHAIGIIPLTASRALQGLGHYGMRAILVMYMIEGPLSMPTLESGRLYSWFVGIAGLLPIFGGLLGDLLMGPRIATITGGFLQAIGCFLLCVPHVAALYAGLGIFALGLGLFNPNIVATLALMYKDRGRMLDSAMMILYIGFTLGALLSPLLSSTLSREFGYWTGFLASGIFLCASQLVLLLSEKNLAGAPYKASIYLEESHRQLSRSNILLPGFISLFVFMPLFWAIYEIGSNLMVNRIIRLDEGVSHSSSSDLLSKIYLIDPAICILLGTILAVIWAFVFASAYLKMAIGFFIYLLAFILFYMAHANGGAPALLIFVIGGYALQTVAELFISPTANALICRYAPVRWTATLLGAFYFLTSVFSHAASYCITYTEELPPGMLLGALGAMVLLLSALYLVLYLLLKARPAEE